MGVLHEMLGLVSTPDSAERGQQLLAKRIGEASGFVSQVPNLLAELKSSPARLPRMLVATGIGTSEGHARHLVEAAHRWLGQPARFVSTGALAREIPPHSEADWLVVFSQGLSANARYAFRDLEKWGGVVLVTGFSAEALWEAPEDKRAWLKNLSARGVIQIDMGCGAEYGMLLRVIGARVGYAVAWSLLRTLAWRRLESRGALECDAERLRIAQDGASEAIREIFPDVDPIAPFFSPERSLILVAEGGRLDLAEQLSLKIAEGMLRPQPRCVDVLQFAHGPLQSLARQPTSILFLAEMSPDAEATLWLERFKQALDPELHDLRILRSQLPLPFGILEFEAMFDQCVMRVIRETGANLVEWPGANREDVLYGAGPTLEQRRDSGLKNSGGRVFSLERAVWPEVEAWIEGGRRTALIALGSIEQHGPHLPLGTDEWIANALAEGLAARVSDAVALPAIAVGCASEHLDFPGTLHVKPATLEAILADLLESLVRHGFERAFVFSAHGGNIDALKEMQSRLCAGAPGLTFRVELDLGAVSRMQARVVAAESLEATSAGPHAGEYETSLIAMLAPGSVRREALHSGRVVSSGEGQNLFYPSLRSNTESGVLGDPSLASAVRGRRYLSAWLDLLEEAYLAAFSASISTRTEKNRQ